LPVLVVRFVMPRSYTGQDAAEIQLPGNPFLVDRVIQQILEQVDNLSAAIARRAQPGEFTARALLAGKLTAEQAEGVGALIAAQTDAQFHAAQSLLTGEMGSRYRALADDVAAALALVEAGIDFTDQEDVVAIAPDDLALRLESTLCAIEEIVGPALSREVPSIAPVAVLAGAPNAGKSTLFNALLGYPRAVVCAAPGTTRDALTETLELSAETTGVGPGRVTLVDLAGLDAALVARSELDAQAQRQALQTIERADVIIWCDPQGRFNDAAFLLKKHHTIIRVRTKADRPLTGGCIDDDALAVCAFDGYHLPVLKRALADAAWGSNAGAEAAGVIPRHAMALQSACHALHDALELTRQQIGCERLKESELIAGTLRTALNELGSISGDISPDDILGRIFATFCIGK